MRTSKDGGRVADHALAILDTLDEGVLVIDRAGRVLAVNTGFCAMVGLGRDDVVGTEPPWRWWPQAERDERLARLRSEMLGDLSSQHQHQVVFERSDGRLILADGRLRVVPGDSSQVVLSYREVTDEALRDQRTARLVETTTDALVRVAPDGTVLFVSDGAAAFAGVPAHEVMGSAMTRFLHPDDGAVVGQAFARALAGEVTTVDYRFIGASGEMYWLEGTSAPILGLDGAVIEVQVLSRDITERVMAGLLNEAVIAVVATEARGGDRTAVEQVIADRAASLTSASSVTVFRVGDDGIEMAATRPHHQDAPADMALAGRAARSSGVVRDTVPGGAPALAVGLPVPRGADGAIVVRGTTSPRCPEVLADFALRVGVALNAAEAHEQLRILADTDPLTGLLNRRAFGVALEDAVAAVRAGAHAALALIDLDGLKDINDSGGHAAGDRALVHIGACVRAEARGGDSLGRLGGDEFAWLIHDADLGAARAAAERLRTAVKDPASGIDGMSASIGITVVRPGDDADSLMRRADDLLYTAKSTGRDHTEASA